MIVIGVGCVIIGAAFGSGTQAAVQEQMSTLGANVLSIWPGQSFGRGGVASSNRVSLTIDDYDGELINAQAGINYSITRNIAIGAAYRYVRYRIGVDKELWNGRMMYELNGPALIAQASF